MQLMKNHANLRNHLLESVKSRERLVVFQSSLVFFLTSHFLLSMVLYNFVYNDRLSTGEKCVRSD